MFGWSESFPLFGACHAMKSLGAESEEMITVARVSQLGQTSWYKRIQLHSHVVTRKHS